MNELMTKSEIGGIKKSLLHMESPRAVCSLILFTLDMIHCR